jgi:hypothetical protein
MQRTLINQILQLDNLTLVERALSDRRDEILQAIEAGTVNPNSDVIKELAELNIALGDVPEVRND